MNTIPHPDENRPKTRVRQPHDLEIPDPPKFKSPYISELKIQLELVKQKIAELEDAAAEGVLSPRFKPEDKERARRLIERRKQLEDRIIFYDP
jgi:hypothetical protein